MTWVLKHKLISAVAVIVLAGFAWYMLSGPSAAPQPVLSADNSATLPQGAQELVQSLLTLRSVTLDGTIFSNSSFQSLQDFSTAIVPVPTGRQDPFAPAAPGSAAQPAAPIGR